jgi:hypothetical protein
MKNWWEAPEWAKGQIMRFRQPDAPSFTVKRRGCTGGPECGCPKITLHCGAHPVEEPCEREAPQPS